MLHKYSGFHYSRDDRHIKLQVGKCCTLYPQNIFAKHPQQPSLSTRGESTANSTDCSTCKYIHQRIFRIYLELLCNVGIWVVHRMHICYFKLFTRQKAAECSFIIYLFAGHPRVFMDTHSINSNVCEVDVSALLA